MAEKRLFAPARSSRRSLIMLISHSHRFIFFHVGKTGGMSIREVLGPYCEDPERFKMRRPSPLLSGRANPMYSIWQTLLLHAKIRDAKNELPPEVFDNYFKFAFVRNPWDLQVSMYHFILREPHAAKHEEVKALGSFDGFVKWVTETPDPDPRGLLKLQKDMISDSNGNPMMDYVGHYESLTADFGCVARSLNIEASLPHLNKSNHKDYRTYYNPQTRDLIAKHFAPDIEYFGYTFEGCRSVVTATA